MYCMIEQKYIDRFHSKITKSGDCWIYGGKGLAFWDGSRVRSARGFAWELSGKELTGSNLYRNCNESECVNPEHAQFEKPEYAKQTRNPEKQFWAFVDKTEDCWYWTGATTANGYGQYYSRYSGELKNWLAHRLAWTIINGPISFGMVLDHSCRDRRCVNPDHLEIVTIQENSKRATRLDPKTECKRGHAFSENNTRIDNKGGRQCILCDELRSEFRIKKRLHGDLFAAMNLLEKYSHKQEVQDWIRKQ